MTHPYTSAGVTPPRPWSPPSDPPPKDEHKGAKWVIGALVVAALVGGGLLSLHCTVGIQAGFAAAYNFTASKLSALMAAKVGVSSVGGLLKILLPTAAGSSLLTVVAFKGKQAYSQIQEHR